jgi:dienelactone hydrolase
MRHFYLPLFFLFFIGTALMPSMMLAQCEGVTVESLTNPGPFEVATLTEADGLRKGVAYQGATVYYPTDATPPFASIAIVPGFTAPPSSVEAWGPFYASHGIVAIVIGTNSPFDFPEARALALLDALETLRQENVRTDSPLEAALDVDKFAVSGWSMGGGGAQRAAVLDDSIKGVVALCPWLPDPALNHDSPVLILSGQNDPTAPPSQHADVHYNVTPSTTDKLLFEVANGNHSVANTPEGGDGAVGRIALSWLKLYVDEDDCYCPLLTESLLVDPPTASKVLSNFECELLGLPENSVATTVYPNPTHHSITVNVQETVGYRIYTTQGQAIASGEVSPNENEIDLSTFGVGVYYVRIGGETLKVIRE